MEDRNEKDILRQSDVNYVETFIVEGRYLISVVHYTYENEKSSTLLIDSANYIVFESDEFRQEQPLAIVEYPVCFDTKGEFEDYAEGHNVLRKYKFTWDIFDRRLQEISSENKDKQR